MSAHAAQKHIEGFLAEVRRINPGFNESSFLGLRTSSLHRLLAHLRTTRNNPRRFTNAAAARLLCADPNDSRLRKYFGAIKNLAMVWGTELPYPGTEVPIGRVVFRSDRRDPNLIFQQGFAPRQGGAIRFRAAQQDVDPDTAVSVSLRPEVAVNFPLPETWGPNAFQTASGIVHVYACYLEQGFNTSGLQGANFAANDQQGRAFSLTNQQAGNVVYAEELATSAVPANRVLGAVQAMRQFIFVPGIPRPNDWFARGTFQFLIPTWQNNQNYNGPLFANLQQVFVPGVRPFVAPVAPVRAPMLS